MRIISKTALIVCLGILLLYGNRLQAERLQAGTASVDITAPLGYPMAGYYLAERRVAKGIHDPLYAQVLLLKTEDVFLALITVDAVFFYSDRVTQEAKVRWGVDYVVINSSHTHSGPWADVKTEDRWDYEKVKDDLWYNSTEDKIINAIGEANNNLFPAMTAAGKGSVASVAYNRRKVEDFGKVTMLWRQEEEIQTFPVDPAVGVIRVDDDSGEPRAVLVHYSCHSVNLGPTNMEYTADYPGYIKKYIQNVFGERCMAFFLQGAAGDINPFRSRDNNVERGFQLAEINGTALGREAVRVARELKPEPNDNASLKVKIDSLSFSHRFEPCRTTEIGIVTLVINDDIAFIGIPGEPFVEFQIDLAARSPIKNTFFSGYTTVGYGVMHVYYLPTIKAAAEGGYGADYVTLLEVGAGERIINRGLINIYQMLGLLKDVPGK